MRAMAVMATASRSRPVELPEPELPTRASRSIEVSDVRRLLQRREDVARAMMPFSDRAVAPPRPWPRDLRARASHEPARTESTRASRATVYHYWPCGRCAGLPAGRRDAVHMLDGWIGFTDPGGFRERMLCP